MKDSNTEAGSDNNNTLPIKKVNNNNSNSTNNNANKNHSSSTAQYSGPNKLHVYNHNQTNNYNIVINNNNNNNNHATYYSSSIPMQNNIVHKKNSTNEHSKRRRIVIVKVEPKEASIYDELIQSREFLEDTIHQLEQKKQPQTQMDDNSCQDHAEKIKKYYDEMIEHLQRRKEADLEKVQQMYTYKKTFQTKIVEHVIILSEQCQQAIDQYHKALESPESINDVMRRQVLYDFYDNTHLDRICIPIRLSSHHYKQSSTNSLKKY